MTSAPSPASATSSRSICAARPPSIDVTRPRLEPERDRLVDEALDRVGDRQIGDEDAVGAVLQRRDEDLAAGEVGALAGFERQRVAQPGAAVDPEREVGAGAAADPDLFRPFELGEQAACRLLELGLGL